MRLVALKTVVKDGRTRLKFAKGWVAAQSIVSSLQQNR